YYSHEDHQDLHSFPTRRSSDLNGCDLPRGFPMYVTTGEIDFVELLQFSRINPLDYYDYLNLGFRITAAAGSDVPWGSTLGEVRRSEEHTSELQSLAYLVCRLLL